MKLKFTPYLCLFIFIGLMSCSKEKSAEPDNQPPEPNPAASGLLSGWRQGTTTQDDTLFTITYDDKKRIKNVNNTSDRDEFIASYDNADNLIEIAENYRGDTSEMMTFKYNANNQLIEADHHLFGHPNRFLYEYTNGVLSKKSYYTITNLNEPNTLNLWRYFTYEITNGNVTHRKEYNSAGELQAEVSYTYTTNANIFQPLSLLNYINNLGLDGVANDESLINNNMPESSSENGKKTTYTYSYNNNKQITGFLVNTPYGVFTRTLSY
ncbi:hypothetical protein HGH93_22805 [Chitinophaga polysaccharea]|uniref:hypothetical protein n=1 Tax=Chitinophaga polysaccharea TaxID=1293035 RepID=UPI001455C7E0|nr:hypothetical protein [Chitinophaga polysaccharea]NLR60951.1 hypothetical protein [Chitinophaga polysaccharea]